MKSTPLVLCLAWLLVGNAPASDSLNVRLVGFCHTPAWALGVAVSGDYAYVADFTDGFRVISVADPANPVEVGYWSTPGNQMRSVEVVGDLAYVADCDSSLRIISVADPSNPAELGHLDLPDRALGVAVSGGHAYVADDDSGLRVISVADPAHPAQVGYYAYVRGAYDVAVVGDYAYVADNGNGLCIVSVADPANPVLAGRYVGTGGALGVAVAGDYAYLAGGSSGLRVDSVTDPTHPVEVGYCDSLGAANDVQVDGDCAYVTSWARGLCVVSVADPKHPVEAGYYAIGSSNSLALDGGYVYVAGHAGLFIFQFYGAGVKEAPCAEVRAANPMPSFVHGVLFLPEASSHKPRAASLLDTTGRIVAELRPGANDVSRLSPGVYFIREVQAQAQAVRKIIVTK